MNSKIVKIECVHRCSECNYPLQYYNVVEICPECGNRTGSYGNIKYFGRSLRGVFITLSLCVSGLTLSIFLLINYYNIRPAWYVPLGREYTYWIFVITWLVLAFLLYLEFSLEWIKNENFFIGLFITLYLIQIAVIAIT